MSRKKKNPKTKAKNQGKSEPVKRKRKIPIWGWLTTASIALIAANFILILLDKLGIHSEFIRISAVGIVAVGSGYLAHPLTAAFPKYFKSKDE